MRESTPRIANDRDLSQSLADAPGFIRRPAYAALFLTKALSSLPGVADTWRSDATWLERTLYPGLGTFEALLRRPFVFDVDDAVWLHRPRGDRLFARVAGRAAISFAGNNHIAEHLATFCRDVRLIPTALDIARYRLRPPAREALFTFGWTGTSSNFRYLASIAEPLMQMLGAGGGRVLIVADEPPTDRRLCGPGFEFRAWDEAQEIALLHEMDVGLAPLADDPWARGKCGLKVLQYLACGIPVIASPVGVNAEILGESGAGLMPTSSDEWHDALVDMRDRSDLLDLGRRGRQFVAARYSVDAVVDDISSAFMDLSTASSRS